MADSSTSAKNTDHDSNDAGNAPSSSSNNINANAVTTTSSNPANTVNTTTPANVSQQAHVQHVQHKQEQSETQHLAEQNTTDSRDATQNTQTRKRSREEMAKDVDIAPHSNDDTNSKSNSTSGTPSNQQIALNVCVENSNNIQPQQPEELISSPPAKKMKLEESKTNTEGATHARDENKSNHQMPAIPNANSDAFDENPYLPTAASSYSTNSTGNKNHNKSNNNNNNNNGYPNHHHAHSRPDEGQVLKRNANDLKRYLNAMDEDILKNDLVSKLCENHENVMEIIRQKMNEHTVLCKIFIRSLSYDTKDQTVYNLFTKYGNVKEAVIVTDRQTGKSRRTTGCVRPTDMNSQQQVCRYINKGFGFITMSNASEAQSALVEHRKMIDNREAICNLASKPQGQKTSGSGPSSSSSSMRPKRDDSSSFHSSSRSDRHSRSKRGDSNDDRYARHMSSSSSSSSRNSRVNSMPANVGAAYPGYPPTTNPYGYDYASAAAANSAANTGYAYPPSAYPQYMYPASAAYAAQYNRAAATPAATAAAANVPNAATANANATMASQPYAPYQPAMAGQSTANMATFGAAPYRFT